MTARESTSSTICNVIQAFPVLLILAQNTNKCVNTPFTYKPPTPTHSPEYYEAYDALIHALLHHSHDCHHGYDKRYVNIKKPCYNSGYPSQTHGYGAPHFGYVYPTVEKYPSHPYPGYSYSSGDKYPGNAYPNVYKYPGYPSYESVYPIHEGGYHGYSHNGYKVANGYNMSTDYVYKTNYAPNQIYNTKHKHKVVVVKTRGHKKSQRLLGFLPQRGDRRYQQNGFNQNFFPDPRKVTNTLQGLFNFQTENSERYAPFVNPFTQRRPIINPNQYENSNQYGNPNKYGNPNQNGNQNQYSDYQNSNSIRFPNQNAPEVYYVYVEQETESPQTEQFKPNPQEIPKMNGNIDIIYNTAPDAPNFVENVPNVVTDAPLLATTTSAPFVDYVPNNSNPPYNAPKPIDIETNQDSAPYNTPESVETTTHKEQGLMSGTLEKGTSYFPSFEDRNNFPNEPPPSDSTRLPPLTPVTSASRSGLPEAVFHSSCTTVDGTEGSCLSVVNCEPYVKLLQQAKTNPTAVSTLRKAHCGFEGNNPMVCCPRLEIPDVPPPELPVTERSTTERQVPVVKTSEPGDFLTAFPEPPECGVSNATFSKVVGGIDAKLGDFPWMALLGYKGTRGQPTRFLCGGSLITSRHVLTAAHCVHNRENDLYVVRLGELDLAREDDGATPVDVLIKTKLKHENYNAKSFANDIAVLLLERDVDFTDLIRPICIPQDSELRGRDFVDYTPFIAGWGDTEFRGPSANHLQVLQLPVVSNEACSQAYLPYQKQIKIDERVLCAGFKKGGKDACQGDSGGPLMQPIWNPQTYKTYFYQIGVVSFGKKCAEPGFPGVYTRVTQFVPWLQKTVLGA